MWMNESNVLNKQYTEFEYNLIQIQNKRQQAKIEKTAIETCELKGKIHPETWNREKFRTSRQFFS